VLCVDLNCNNNSFTDNTTDLLKLFAMMAPPGDNYTTLLYLRSIKALMR